MGKNSSNLLFLAIGAAVGAAVGYVVASDKKEQWIAEINNLVDRVKKNVSGCCCSDPDCECHEEETGLNELSENEE